MHWVLFSSHGLQSAIDKHVGAVTTPCTLPVHFYLFQVSTLGSLIYFFSLLPEIEKCSLALLPFENIKITQGHSYFQRAEATLGREKSAKS